MRSNIPPGLAAAIIMSAISGAAAKARESGLNSPFPTGPEPDTRSLDEVKESLKEGHTDEMDKRRLAELCGCPDCQAQLAVETGLRSSAMKDAKVSFSIPLTNGERIIGDIDHILLGEMEDDTTLVVPDKIKRAFEDTDVLVGLPIGWTVINYIETGDGVLPDNIRSMLQRFPDGFVRTTILDLIAKRDAMKPIPVEQLTDEMSDQECRNLEHQLMLRTLVTQTLVSMNTLQAILTGTPGADDVVGSLDDAIEELEAFRDVTEPE